MQPLAPPRQHNEGVDGRRQEGGVFVAIAEPLHQYQRLQEVVVEEGGGGDRRHPAGEVGPEVTKGHLAAQQGAGVCGEMEEGDGYLEVRAAGGQLERDGMLRFIIKTKMKWFICVNINLIGYLTLASKVLIKLYK